MSTEHIPRNRRPSERVAALLAGVGDLLVVFGVVLHLVRHHLLAPRSLAVLIGPWSVAWIFATLALLTAGGLLACLTQFTPLHRFEGVARLFAGLLLTTYGVVLFYHGGTLTAGLGTAWGLGQFARLAHMRWVET